MSNAIRVQRVTLPRYEIEYTEARQGLEDAKRARQSHVLTLPVPLSEEHGSEVVCDLLLAGLPVATTLLFRIVQKPSPLTVLEWWPRRKTDPDLLDLWIESLELRVHQHAPSMPPNIPTEELHQLLYTCRTALAHNPFVALGVHWTARGEDVEQAANKIEVTLKQYRARPGLLPRGAELIDAALAHLPQARQSLATLEARQAARARFVPREQLRHARELALTRVELSTLRGNPDEKRLAVEELNELTPVSRRV